MRGRAAGRRRDLARSERPNAMEPSQLAAMPDPDCRQPQGPQGSGTGARRWSGAAGGGAHLMWEGTRRCGPFSFSFTVDCLPPRSIRSTACAVAYHWRAHT